MTADLGVFPLVVALGVAGAGIRWYWAVLDTFTGFPRNHPIGPNRGGFTPPNRGIT